MSDEASSTIVINAAPAAVMAVIADLPAYPAWTSFMSDVTVLDTYPDGRAKQARFTLDAGPIKDVYSVEYTWCDKGVSWKLVEGQMLKEMVGEYTVTAVGDTTEVNYRLEVDTAIPVIGLLKRKAERAIIDTALKGLKKRVESATGPAGS